MQASRQLEYTPSMANEKDFWLVPKGYKQETKAAVRALAIIITYALGVLALVGIAFGLLWNALI